MNYLTIPFFKTLLKKKETKIALLFSLYPMLLMVVGLFSTNFMRLSAPVGSLSFLEFFGAVLSTQYQMTLPLVVFIYLVSTIFRDEVTSGVMYLYKDISKKVILDAKLSAVFLLQVLYIFVTFVSSLVTYYIYLIHQPYTSGNLFPSQKADLDDAIVSILGIFLVFILVLLVSSLASIALSNGFTMLVGIVFSLVSFISPHLSTLKYLFPNGYVSILGDMSFSLILVVMLALFLAYYLVLYLTSLHLFKKVEF